MELIKPKLVFEDAINATFVVQEIKKLKTDGIVIIVDGNIKNIVVDELLNYFYRDLKVCYLLKYPGTEPTTTHIDKVITEIKNLNFEAIVAIGGGSTLDFAKAISVLIFEKKEVSSADFQGTNFSALGKKICICIPTTAGSGAEATKSAVLFNPSLRIKRGINNPLVLPDVVFLVPGILENLPFKILYPSLIDGLTHAFESLIGVSATHKTKDLAADALRIYGSYLSSGLNENPYPRDLLKASFLAGVAICNSETGPIHALSYPLTENFGISHGSAISMILPRVIELYSEMSDSLIADFLNYSNFQSCKSLIHTIDSLNDKYLDLKLESNSNLNVLANRSLELKGAINNSPIPWKFEHSMQIYKEIFKNDKLGMVEL